MLPRAGLKEIILWLLRKRRRFRVAGHSMEPIIHDGDEVLVKPLFTEKVKSRQDANLYDRTSLRPRAGDDNDEAVLVVAEHPHQTGVLIIKQRDGSGLRSFCHNECGVRSSKILGRVTSVL